MKKPGAITIAYLLLGLLAIATASILLGSRESIVNPSPRSFGPSGTAALVSLLRDFGYRVEFSGSINPARSRDDLLLLIPVGDGIRDLTATSEGEPPAWTNARRHVQSGGSALILPLDDGFPEASRQPSETRVLGPINQDLQLRTTNQRWNTVLLPGSVAGADRFSYSEEETAFVRIAKLGDGLAASLDDGSIATNRLLDQGDNPVILTDVVARLAPAGSRIVVAEAVFGARTAPSLLETIGPWAVAAWRQALVLFAVIVFTLGIRFGIAEEWRRRELGQRELVDAVGETFLRARSTAVTADAIYRATDRRVRRHLRLPSEAPDRVRDERITPALRDALATLESTAKGDREPKPTELLAAARTATEESDQLR